jgi:hypothetical protein
LFNGEGCRVADVHRCDRSDVTIASVNPLMRILLDTTPLGLFNRPSKKGRNAVDNSGIPQRNN